MDYIFVRLNLTYLPANNLRRISTMYVRGYLQGSENGRVVTIDGSAARPDCAILVALKE